MFEVKIDKGEVSCNIAGSTVEILTDVTCLCSIIYKGLPEEERKKFVVSLKSMANDEIYTMNQEQLEEKVKKQKEEGKKAIDNLMKEIGSLFE